MNAPMTEPLGREQGGESRLAGAVALLFSGGLDTTLEAVARLKTHRHVHLVTFDNGCCINVCSAARRAAELQASFDPGRIHHALVDTRRLRTILMERVRHLPRRPRSPLVFDLACKMAGVAELIAYAVQNRVAEVSDGSARAQTEIFIQRPEFAAHIEPFVAAYGCRLIHPVMFNVSRGDKMAALEKLGLRSGPHFFEALHVTSQLARQPFCLRGFITFFYTSPLRKLPPLVRSALSLDEAKQLWDDLLPTAKTYLAGKLSVRAGEAPR